MKKLLKVLLIGIAVVIVGCVALALLVPSTPKTATPKTSAVIAVTLMVPQSTQAAQPVALVATLAPTVEPPTPTPDLDAANNAYADQSKAVVREFGDAMGDMQVLLKYVSNDSAVLTDPEWLGKIQAVYPRYRAVITKLRALQPTPKFQRTQDRLLEFADYLEKGTDALEIGVRDIDVPKIAEAGKHFANSTVAMGAAVEEMKKAQGITS